ncbi:putative biological adhesion [Trypoxylus dichotomus]
MFFPVSTVAALCVLVEVADGSRASDNELDSIFRGRTKSQWEEAWHREKFVRCRETLMSHLYWACEKDIYRITRRSKPAVHPIEFDTGDVPCSVTPQLHIRLCKASSNQVDPHWGDASFDAVQHPPGPKTARETTRGLSNRV